MDGAKAGPVLGALHGVQLVDQAVPLAPAGGRSVAARLLGVAGSRAHGACAG